MTRSARSGREKGRCSDGTRSSANRQRYQRPTTTVAAARAARALGLPSATALVIGSIIGTGVFTMPAVMAGAGTSSIIVLGVISIGALLLGVLFGQLTKRIPTSDGGLYAYARHEFGDFAGYLTAWCYWITAWAGNAAIVSSWVLYVESLFSITHPSAWTNFGIAMCGLWIPAAVNLVGVRQMALVPEHHGRPEVPAARRRGHRRLVLRPLRQLRPLQRDRRQPLQRHRHRGRRGALLVHRRRGGLDHRRPGEEPAEERRPGLGARNRQPARFLYLLVTAAVMGLVPHHALVGNGAPFVNAFQAMFSNFSWAGKLVAAVAVVSGIGALNGWTLVTAEMPRAAAKDGLFLPQFAKTIPRRDALVRHPRLDARRLVAHGLRLQRQDRA